jgi:hypothetical protein
LFSTPTRKEPTTQHDLIDLYGEPIPVVVDMTATTIMLNKVRECIAAASPLTSPHRDGWRMEHLEILSRDDAFATALATFISNIAIGDVPATTADYLALATLVALLKKSEVDIHALRELLGPYFFLPIRPLAMACVFVKLACNCVLSGIKDDIT